MKSYSIDFPELFYYCVPVALHILVSRLSHRWEIGKRRTLFFISNSLAILGVAGVSFLVKVSADHVERFSESMIVLSVLIGFDLYYIYKKLNK